MTTETKAKYYGEDRETDEAVEALVRREVLYCQSALVEELLKCDDVGGFGYEDIENVYPDPSDWEIDQCEEFVSDRGLTINDYPYPNEDEYLERLHEVIRDNAESQEIYEWWLVTHWAADELSTIGQPILRAANCTWWGRTCTGQSIVFDPTFYEIYADMEN